MTGPRYIATRLNGDGSETIIDGDLPLTEFEDGRVLNNGAEISARIAPRFQYLYDENDELLLQKWGTAIYSVDGGDVTGGILVDYNETKQGTLELDIMGFAAYPNGMPYTDSWVMVEIDPIDVFREGWRHLQAEPRGNLGLVLDDTKAGYKIGQMVAQAEFDTEEGPLQLEYEPVRFSWYETDDLGSALTDLATNTPFDFTEIHTFNEEDQTFGHRLAIGYPRLGRRRHDLRFVIGENIEIPDLEGGGSEYASGVLALGAGEGSAMMRALVHRAGEHRIRRIHVLDTKDSQTAGSANLAAQAELAKHHGLSTITRVNILPGHDEGSQLVVGDEINVWGRAGTREINLWVRVVKITKKHGGDGTVELDVVGDATLGA